jgi:hypothetical protein
VDKNYKLNTNHVTGGVVVEDTREGEVDGSIPNNPTCVVTLMETGEWGWVGSSP